MDFHDRNDLETLGVGGLFVIITVGLLAIFAALFLTGVLP